MESIYWVISWLCHRKCEHCYEDRFHPYYGDELNQVVQESEEAFRGVIANLPPKMIYRDVSDGLKEKRGRIILAGGEVLLEPVRRNVLYPALDLLYEKYKNVGGVDLIIQTTGDVLTSRILEELLAHHVDLVSVSGLDHFHEGLEEEPARTALRAKLQQMFAAQGVREFPAAADRATLTGPYYHFFGATKDSWIGKIWPRGRAQTNELSTATLADNFCNAWSGGLHFLDMDHGGSEVSIEPNGNVYPCCMKTKKALGNLCEEPLESILGRLQGNPVYEAISMGHPERMGVTKGWSVEDFYRASTTTLPSGRQYQNLCIGCDKFHDQMLTPSALLVFPK